MYCFERGCCITTRREVIDWSVEMSHPSSLPLPPSLTSPPSPAPLTLPPSLYLLHPSSFLPLTLPPSITLPLPSYPTFCILPPLRLSPPPPPPPHPLPLTLPPHPLPLTLPPPSCPHLIHKLHGYLALEQVLNDCLYASLDNRNKVNKR